MLHLITNSYGACNFSVFIMSWHNFFLCGVQPFFVTLHDEFVSPNDLKALYMEMRRIVSYSSLFWNAHLPLQCTTGAPSGMHSSLLLDNF